MSERTDTDNGCRRCQESLLSVRGAAELLSISAKTIRNKLSAGVFPIPSYKFGGKRLFKMSEVLEYIRDLT
jgi:excisionase family DNA binding protein